jgi:hypothetical protein
MRQRLAGGSAFLFVGFAPDGSAGLGLGIAETWLWGNEVNWRDRWIRQEIDSRVGKGRKNF